MFLLLYLYCYENDDKQYMVVAYKLYRGAVSHYCIC